MGATASFPGCIASVHPAPRHGPRVSAARKDGEVIALSSFVVSEEREGNAKAIMEQRAALNMMNSVATDNFGDVTSGSLGEFVK